MRTIPVEPVSPFTNPTSLTLSSSSTIPATARYVVRLNPTADVLLSGRAGMSNLLQNEGSYLVTVYPVGSASVNLYPGYECMLSWDSAQQKHEVQPPTQVAGAVLDNSVTSGSANGVKSSGIYTYVEGNHGGAVVRATGVSATDTAALNAAVATGARKILIDDKVAPLVLAGGGTIYLNNTRLMPLTNEANIRLSNNTILQFGQYYNAAVQTSWQTFTLSADKAVVTSAGLTGVAVGDVLIFSSANAITEISPHFSSGTQLPGETAVVKEIAGNNYTLDTQLVDTYTTTPKVALLSRTGAAGSVQTLSVDCGLERITFSGSNQGGTAVTFYSCLRPRVKDVVLENCGQIYFGLCNKPRVSRIEIPYQRDANSDYGIAIGWTDEGRFDSINSQSCRHAVTTGAGFASGSTRMSTNRRNLIVNSVAQIDGLDAGTGTNIAFDTHSEGYGTEYRDCKVILTGPSTISPLAGPSLIGFSDRARYTKYVRCSVQGNKASLHRGWTLYGYGTEVIDCDMDGGWGGVLTQSIQILNSSGQYVPARYVKVLGGFFRNIRNEAVIFDGGTGHRVRGITVLASGESSYGLWGSVRAGVAVIDHLSLGLTDIEISGCTIPKQNNLYSVGIDVLTQANIVIKDNVFEGYGNASIGLDRTLATAPQVEATWGNWQRDRPRYLYAQDTSHGYTVGSHLYQPLDIDFNLYDDTATLVPIAGVIVDVINVDWLVLAQPGQDLLLPDSMLSGSYNISADGRKLYWDQSLAKFIKTKPGDSHATAPVFLHVFSYFDSVLRCRVVGA